MAAEAPGSATRRPPQLSYIGNGFRIRLAILLMSKAYVNAVLLAIHSATVPTGITTNPVRGRPW